MYIIYPNTINYVNLIENTTILYFNTMEINKYFHFLSLFQISFKCLNLTHNKTINWYVKSQTKIGTTLLHMYINKLWKKNYIINILQDKEQYKYGHIFMQLHILKNLE